MNNDQLVYRFDATRRDDAGLADAAREVPVTGRRGPLLCAACGHRVTYESERIPVAGSHYHTHTNPAGIVYHIGCFRYAPGCSMLGRATQEHTWFSGYRWQIAVCANCGEHLGWLFQNGSEFHGLITARLASLS